MDFPYIMSLLDNLFRLDVNKFIATPLIQKIRSSDLSDVAEAVDCASSVLSALASAKVASFNNRYGVCKCVSRLYKIL